MGGFVKLDCGILDSTLWVDRECREIFITALLMALPYELEQSLEQIEVDTLDHTGFVVPPGWYGFVHAAGVGIIRRAGLDQDRGELALKKLGSPEKESRSGDFEGRRLVRVNGGYLVLNYMKYRDRDYTAPERMRKYRAKKAKEVTRNDDELRVTLRMQKSEAEVRSIEEETRKNASAPVETQQPQPSQQESTRQPSSTDEREAAQSCWEEIRRTYPAGTYRENEWLVAEKRYWTLVEQGYIPAVIRDNVLAYYDQQAAKAGIGTQYVLAPSRFLDNDNWRGPFPIPVSKTKPVKPECLQTQEEYDEMVARQKAGGLI